jgi:Ca2+/Na+ antiporter
MEKKKTFLGTMLIIIPSVVLAFGDINIGEIIWATFSIITGLFVLHSEWSKSKNEDKSSPKYGSKLNAKDMKKWINISALIGGILSIISLLQADLSILEKILSIFCSLILIVVIAKIILNISLKKIKSP